VRGGPGNDVLDGGDGRDFVSYVWSDAAVVVDLWSGEGTGEGTDTLISFEHAKGSAYADWLRGTAADNRLWGYGGNDRLAGRAGDDWADGGGGSDVCLVETPINC
jgi:Ca2+-binding RTX toxin-like protein